MIINIINPMINNTTTKSSILAFSAKSNYDPNMYTFTNLAILYHYSTIISPYVP